MRGGGGGMGVGGVSPVRTLGLPFLLNSVLRQQTLGGCWEEQVEDKSPGLLPFDLPSIPARLP